MNASEQGRFLKACGTCVARVNVVPSAPAEPAAPCRRHPALSAASLSSGAAEPARGIHTETERSAEKASEKSCGYHAVGSKHNKVLFSINLFCPYL